jgi:hypothetical protein
VAYGLAGAPADAPKNFETSYAIKSASFAHILAQIETEARRQLSRDQFDALLRMQRAVQTMALAREARTGPGRSSADFAAALADYNAELPLFPGRNQPGALGDAIYQLSGADLEAMGAANTATARSDLETELAQIRAN